MKKLIALILIAIFPATAAADETEMSSAGYTLKWGTFSASSASSSSGNYSLNNLAGIDGIRIIRTSLYDAYFGFFYLNSIPEVSLVSYNNSRPIEDSTPTLSWIYTDSDLDPQLRYQLQIAHASFDTPVLDTGIVTSAASSFTSSLLPQIQERTAYYWRIRVYDGFSWSGWDQAENGFILTTAEFLISGLSASTTPGGAVIDESAWQTDNDPYFYWSAPPTGIVVVGYSYTLDVLPDETIDTYGTYFTFAQDQINDGVHTFYVQAQRSSGIWSDPVAFDIWVDTTAPSVSYLAPTLGGVLSTDLPQLGAIVSDIASGVDPQAIEMRVEQAQVMPEYDPETGELSYTPTIPLSDGEVSVSLMAYDAVGNYGLPLTWTFIVDTSAPVGSLVINNDDEMTPTNIVTLSISAEDETTDITEMMLSNDGVFDSEAWEPYTDLRRNWLLPAVNGMHQVFLKLKDEADNISEIFIDSINLVIIAPDTYIFSGPSGITQINDAYFTFRGSLDDCQFSYKFDNQDWSEWVTDVSVNQTELAEGNHYFMVKAAKDLNEDGLLQVDEVDPTPAYRVWTISTDRSLQPPAQPEIPIKRWETD